MHQVLQCTNSGNPNITGTVAGYLGNVITDLASSMNMTTGHEQDAERIRKFNKL